MKLPEDTWATVTAEKTAPSGLASCRAGLDCCKAVAATAQPFDGTAAWPPVRLTERLAVLPSNGPSWPHTEASGARVPLRIAFCRWLD